MRRPGRRRLDSSGRPLLELHNADAFPILKRSNKQFWLVPRSRGTDHSRVVDARGLRERCVMYKRIRTTGLVALGMLFWLMACSADGGQTISKAPPAPEMPDDWKVVSNFDAPVEQTKQIAQNLGVNLSSLRNTLYDVNGKSVQLNVIITPDQANADKLMTKLRTMKGEVALLRKDLIVYEFVGQNDVLPLIAEGRKHLDSK